MEYLLFSAKGDKQKKKFYLNIKVLNKCALATPEHSYEFYKGFSQNNSFETSNVNWWD